MRNKLSTFSDFANTLYPHEADYLLSVQQFNKSDNLKVVNLINYNSKNPLNLLPYSTTIDKRTYSYLKKWIEETLSKVDVDHFYEWLIGIEKQVMTDSISADEEKHLLERAATIDATHYYFIRFYQVLQHYRDYLMVRNRTRYYTEISCYLEKFQKEYLRSVELNNDLNAAAEKVVFQLAKTHEEYNIWEKLFSEIYFDTTLDGYTRYRAVVRLTILYYYSREFDKLRTVYEHLDSQFKTPIFYSKRILANYYANRAMMHSKLNELDEAEKYGYLSIRKRNSDYLFYLVNLCGVLLRKPKNKEALSLMTNSMVELKNTVSLYYKIGFVSFYIKTLDANNLHDKAVSYATTFFEGYKSDIFKFRWHLFFSSFLQVLIRSEKYAKAISYSRRYKLVAKEKQYSDKAVYLPIIYWYTLLAEYMEGIITLEKFKMSILASGSELVKSKYQARKIMELLDEMAFVLPAEVKDIKEQLKC
jgi:hypothetical protein